MPKPRITSLLAAALATAVLVTPTLSVASPKVRATELTSTRPAPGARSQQAAQYQQWVEACTSTAQSRIATVLRKENVAPALASHILVDVNYGVALIRQRATSYTSDQQVSSWEKQQLNVLAQAIRIDLAKHYGNLDSWALLG